MKRKVASEILLTLLSINILTLAFHIQPVRSEPKTWIVDDDGPADFPTIQEAINAANSRDTIYVKSGTYHENVIVNKTVSLLGEDRSITTIDANAKGSVIVVTADAVSIKNFTIQNSGRYPSDSGIVLGKSKNSVVDGNILTMNGFGIYLSISNDNTLARNIFINNWYGIDFLLSSKNIVTENVIVNNNHGIFLGESGGNVLRNNSMFSNVYNFGVVGDELSDFVNEIDISNKVDGKTVYYLINKQSLVIDPSTFPNAGYLAIVNSTRVTVRDLNFSNNFQGVLFVYTTNSKIERMKVSRNFHGIMISGLNNTVRGNNATKNIYGITSSGNSDFYIGNVIRNNDDGMFVSGSNNFIKRNNITNNKGRGIYLIGSHNTVYQNEIMNNSVGIVIDLYDNKIYHNNFTDNAKQADLNMPERAVGIWDDGYPSGGNYWSNYAVVDLKRGPYQNITGGDGIVDAPYIIDANNRDGYPFVNPYVPLQGDLNDDNKVDVDDIVEAALAFGAHPEHPRWNPQVDINQDNRVDIDDIILIAMNFGKTYP